MLSTVTGEHREPCVLVQIVLCECIGRMVDMVEEMTEWNKGRRFGRKTVLWSEGGLQGLREGLKELTAS